MNDYLQNRWVKIGLALLVFGSSPLLLIILFAKLGLTSDPDPNPIFFGILAGLTFWPALACLVIGVLRVRRKSRRVD